MGRLKRVLFTALGIALICGPALAQGQSYADWFESTIRNSHPDQRTYVDPQGRVYQNYPANEGRYPAQYQNGQYTNGQYPNPNRIDYRRAELNYQGHQSQAAGYQGQNSYYERAQYDEAQARWEEEQRRAEEERLENQRRNQKILQDLQRRARQRQQQNR